jgi:hypothetical protein
VQFLALPAARAAPRAIPASHLQLPALAAAPRRWLSAAHSAAVRRVPVRISCASAKPLPDGDAAQKAAQKRLEHEEHLWDDHFAQLRAYAAANGGSTAVPRAYPTRALGSWVLIQRGNRKTGTLSAQRVAQLDAISFPWEPREQGWDERYGELERYAAAHGGSTDVSQTSTEWRGLGLWLSRQRTGWLDGTLSADRIAKLERLGVEAAPFDNAWHARYAQLEAIAAARGDSVTHVSAQDEAQFPGLADWLTHQRKMWRAGKLPAERVAKLQALRVQLDTSDAAWESQLHSLTTALQAHGGALAAACVASAPLAKWVSTQQLEERAGRLPGDKRARLDALGVDWRSPDATAGAQQRRPGREDRTALWETRYNELVAYVALHGGSTSVPCKNGDAHKVLGAWVNRQRAKHKAGELSPEQVTKLDALHFVWHPEDELFVQRCAELAAYKASHGGRMNVTRRENAVLERFIARVRNQARTKGMDSFRPDELARLQALGFDWQA